MEFITQIDKAVLFGVEALHCPALNWLMGLFTTLGEKGIVWIALGLALLCFKKTRRAGIAVLLALILGALMCNVTLKPLIARPRPFAAYPDIVLMIKQPGEFSFPSGHTVSSFAAAVAVLLHDRRIGIPTAVLAVLVAFSRLYFQVHYLTDVLAGILIGALAGVIAWLLVKLAAKKIKSI